MISQTPALLAQSTIPEVPVEHSGYFFPAQASEFAARSDNLYMFIFWVSTFFFLVIVGLMCYFVVKYRRQPGVKPLPSPSHNTTIEILWSVLPSIILVYIFYEGAAGFFQTRIAPDDAEEIQVEAYQFGWTFTYPDGDISNELHIVQNRPVKLVMRSKDVLHSFYIAAFRQKMDIVPGRYTYVYLQPNRIGRYRLSCTEYCGDNHSQMRTVCVVHRTNEERKSQTEWKTPEHSPWINGQRLYKIHCAGCHNINGVAGTGPALNLAWGETRKLTDGTSVLVDENYITESIKYPNAKIHEGYGPVSKMQSFLGKLSDQDISYLISFMKLKDQMTAPPADKGTASEEGAATPASEQTPAAPVTGATPETKTEATPAAESTTGDAGSGEKGERP